VTVTSAAPGSFDQVVRSSERRLLRIGLMLSGNAHTAEDLVQSVLARAHRRCDRIGELVRETSVSKENRANRLPAAIKFHSLRRFGPVLAAAAAVVVVLGGGIVVRQNLTPLTFRLDEKAGTWKVTGTV
jgi:hypothetical protein